MPRAFVKISFEHSLGPRSVFPCSVSNLLSVAQGTVNRITQVIKEKSFNKKGNCPQTHRSPEGYGDLRLKVVVTVATAKKLKRIGSLRIPFRTVIGGPTGVLSKLAQFHPTVWKDEPLFKVLERFLEFRQLQRRLWEF